MELTFALAIAADYYRDGLFTPAYASRRIEEIRALLREYKPTMNDRWAFACIPPLDATECNLWLGMMEG